MEGEILKFLYEFYERGDYPNKSLFDILDKLPTQWDDQKSIDDLKERIARLKSGGLIEGDWSDDGFKSWGQTVEDKTFAYREHPLNARLTDKGAELVERRLEKERQKKVDDSLLETNQSVKNTNTSTQNLYNVTLPNNFKSQNIATYISIGVGALSLIFIGISTYYQATDKTPKEVQRLKEEVIETQKKLQKIESSIKEVNSSIQKVVTDTILVKKKRD